MTCSIDPLMHHAYKLLTAMQLHVDPLECKDTAGGRALTAWHRHVSHACVTGPHYES